MRANHREDVFEHFRRQAPRIRIVTRAVIAVGQHQFALADLNLVKHVVGEFERGLRVTKCRERCFVCQSAEGEHHLQVWHGCQFGFVERSAGDDFGPDWFVLWRHATDGIGDPAVDQFHVVIRVCFVGAARKPEFLQCRVEQVTCIVSGKRARSAVCPLQTGGQPDDQQARVPASETWDWSIVKIGKLRGVLVAKFSQPRAEWTVMSRDRR